MENGKNIIIFSVLSVAILVVYFMFVVPMVTPPPQPAQAPSTQQSGEIAPGGVAPAPGGPTQPLAPTAVRERAEVLAENPRIPIRTPQIQGSIDLTGGQIDDLVLPKYKVDIEPGSPSIVLLSPRGTANPYYAAFRWYAADDTEVPGGDTVWQGGDQPLTPDNPVTLTWSNGTGQRFELHVEVDPNFLFTVRQRVVNEGESAVSVAAYALVNRTGTPPASNDYIVHEGPISVLQDTYVEHSYDDLKDAGNSGIVTKSTGGWLGFTDKYWSVLLIPQQDEALDTRFVRAIQQGRDVFQADATYPTQTVAPGASAERTTHLFSGAREPAIVDAYDETLGAPKFYLAVDYGWIFFLSRPIYIALHWFYGLVGNFGVAILLLVVCVRILLFPLANKAYKSMARMRVLQPKMLELRERYKDDRARFQQEIMGLYRKEGANPLAGCLPILVQIPIFIALYNVLYGTIEMRHAPFFGWIQDLSAPDPTSWMNLFGLLPYDVPNLGLLNLLSLGIWPLLMGITMWLQYRLNPQPTDPMQAKIFAWMPVIFTFMLGHFAAGLVIYWAWNNTLSMAQQAFIMHRHGTPIGRKAQAAAAAKEKEKAEKEKAEKERKEQAKAADKPAEAPKAIAAPKPSSPTRPKPTGRSKPKR